MKYARAASIANNTYSKDDTGRQLELIPPKTPTISLTLYFNPDPG